MTHNSISCFLSFSPPMNVLVSELLKLKLRSSKAFMMSNITTISSSASSPSSPSMSVSHQVGIAILTLAFVLGFPGNLFVVWSVFCKVRKRSVTCVLVLNLALADAFVLLSAPLFLRYLAGGRGWEFGSAACKLVHYLSNVNMYVSIYLICLMSMDRWLAVTRPFLSQRMRTKRSLLVILLGIWVISFILSLPMPFYRRWDTYRHYKYSASVSRIHTLQSCQSSILDRYLITIDRYPKICLEII